jgi:hypothetical protein
MGVGCETIGEVLSKNDFPVNLLLALLIARLTLTPVSLGGGFYDSVFAPLLFIGSMLGGAVGADVIRAYEIVLTRCVTQRQQEHAVRLDALAPPRVDGSDLAVEYGALIDGRRIGEIPFPPGCVVASVRRRGQDSIPHGDTMLHAGDLLVVVAEGRARDEVVRLCQRPASSDL